MKASNYHHLLVDKAIQQTVRESIEESPPGVTTNHWLHLGILKYGVNRVLNCEEELFP